MVRASDLNRKTQTQGKMSSIASTTIRSMRASSVRTTPVGSLRVSTSGPAILSLRASTIRPTQVLYQRPITTSSSTNASPLKNRQSRKDDDNLPTSDRLKRIASKSYKPWQHNLWGEHHPWNREENKSSDRRWERYLIVVLLLSLYFDILDAKEFVARKKIQNEPAQSPGKKENVLLTGEQGKPKEAPAGTEDKDWHTDPSTSLQLPRRISSPLSLPSDSSSTPFVILSSGVRTVTFLGIQVYVASLYIHEDKFNRFLETHNPSNTNLESLISTLLQQNIPMVLRITPVRNTDFHHLRDGFVRAIQGKSKDDPQGSDDDLIGIAIQTFKSSFPKSSLKKHIDLDVVLSDQSSIALESEKKILGSVNSKHLGRYLLQAYMSDKNPVSKPFRDALHQELVQRKVLLS
ncbi:unnamed protein product [Sympodiomycopsis kandeliae]